MSSESAPVDATGIRNIGIIAHIDAGKTTVTERILFYSGKERRMGEVHDGTATMDYLREEQERGITITSAATQVRWRDFEINLIDTPGHVDFTAEVERSLRVLDGAIGVFCAVGGVEAQSETVWRQADRHHVPRLVFINKMDRVGADFDRVVEQIRTRLRANPVVLLRPIGSASDYAGIIDLVRMEAIFYDDESQGARFRREPIPEALRPGAVAARARLEEQLAETSDELTDLFLTHDTLSFEQLVGGIRAATLAGRIVPVFCGSALKNKGVQRLLDGVVAFLPGPADVRPVVGRHPDTGAPIPVPSDPDAPLVAMGFKTVGNRHGDLTFVRVYAGRLKAGQAVWNPRLGRAERVSRLFLMHAESRTAVDEVGPGAIVAAAGLKATVTGDTLCDRAHPVVLESMTFPDTVLGVAIEPRGGADREGLDAALRQLRKEDPTLSWREDPETGQLLLLGMGELHLDIARKRLENDFGVHVNVGRPRVAFKQTVGEAVEVEGRFVKQIAATTQFAHVVIRVEPSPSETLEFVDQTSAEQVPRAFVPSVRAGCEDSARSGFRLGYPIIRLRVTLLHGTHQEEESTDVAFYQAASRAFDAAMEAGRALLLEPYMKLRVVVAAEFLSNLIADLASRRANVESIDSGVEPSELVVSVPLSEVFGYASVCRSLSQGRAAFSMEPLEYRPVPSELVARVTG